MASKDIYIGELLGGCGIVGPRIEMFVNACLDGDLGACLGVKADLGSYGDQYFEGILRGRMG